MTSDEDRGRIFVSMNVLVTGCEGSFNNRRKTEASLRMDKSVEIILKNELPCSFRKP